MKTLRWIVCVVCMCAPAGLMAQVAGRIGAGVGYEVFSFGTPNAVGVESVSLLTVPVGTRIRLSNGFAFEVLSAWAAGRLVRASGAESTIDGPTDTELRLEYGMGRGLLQLTAIAQLPTGKQSLTVEEIDVAGVIAADVLPFRITNWGSGGGAGGSAALSRAFGNFAAGLSVGYVVAREFEPVAEQTVKYRPGDQLSVRAAIDHTFGNSGKLALVVAAQRYTEDETDGNNLFQAGNRYEAVGSFAFAVGSRGAGVAYVGYLYRDEGEFTASTVVTPIEGLLFAGAGLELPVGSALLRPRVDLRVLGRDDGVGQGYTVTAGADTEFRLSGITIVPTARGRIGNLTLNDTFESSFTGFDVGLAIRFGRLDQ